MQTCLGVVSLPRWLDCGDLEVPGGVPVRFAAIRPRRGSVRHY